MTDTRYVYLMETETEGRYKIGYSVNPESRAKQITADVNQQETIKGVIVCCETSYYKELESMFHARYADYRVWSNREYFDFSPKTLDRVITEFSVLVDANNAIGNLVKSMFPESEENELKQQRDYWQSRYEYLLDNVYSMLQHAPLLRGDVTDKLHQVGEILRNDADVLDTQEKQIKRMEEDLEFLNLEVEDLVSIMEAFEKLVQMKRADADTVMAVFSLMRKSIYDLRISTNRRSK